jgi:hypothetical protein
VFFTRTGANDSNFNLRRDPSYILRSKNKNQTFVNIIEPHGSYSPVTEIAMNSKTSVIGIEKIEDNASITAMKIKTKEGDILIIQSNDDNNPDHQHVINLNGLEMKWSGPYYVSFNNAKLQ